MSYVKDKPPTYRYEGGDIFPGPPRVEVFHIKVPGFQTPLRIDKFLASRLPSHISRSQLQKLLKNGLVTVDRRVVKASYQVRPNEEIEVKYEPPYEPTIYGENIPLDILYEDPYLLVINKPPGLVVHPGAGNATHTLVNALVYHCDHLSNENGPLRPGIVHRLDKDTSGVMLTAKDNRVHAGLRRQFTHRRIEKEYLALVWGQFTEDEGLIDLPIGRHPRHRKKFAVVPQGRPSRTRFRVLERFSFLTLLQLELETGRTHQIRVHLSHLGHPVFGDPFYGGRSSRLGSLPPAQRRLAARLLELIPRQALHARRLSFIHPITSKRLTIEAPLADDFQQILDELHHEGD